MFTLQGLTKVGGEEVSVSWYAPGERREAPGIVERGPLGCRAEAVAENAGEIRVRCQADRKGAAVEPKTRRARRTVALMPALGKLLREHRLASPPALSTDEYPMFSSSAGTPLDARNIDRRVFAPALKRAGLDESRLRWLDLRHTFASILVAQGEDAVYVSEQLGHADAAITFRVYAHLFDRAERRKRAAGRMEATHGVLLAFSQALSSEPSQTGI